MRLPRFGKRDFPFRKRDSELEYEPTYSEEFDSNLDGSEFFQPLYYDPPDVESIETVQIVGDQVDEQRVAVAESFVNVHDEPVEDEIRRPELISDASFSTETDLESGDTQFGQTSELNESSNSAPLDTSELNIKDGLTRLIANAKVTIDDNFQTLSNALQRRVSREGNTEDVGDSQAEDIEQPFPKGQWFSLNTMPDTGSQWSPRAILRAIEDIVRRRTLTLTVENGVVRIVVFQGSQVVAWGTAHPFEDNPPDTELGTIDDEYADKAYSLLSDMDFRRLRLVTELPLYSPLLRNLKLPAMRMRYFNQVVLSEVIETIPFSQEEVDVVWQRKSSKTEHEVLAVVVPKSNVDEHVKLLKRANFTPGAAYPKALSLVAAVGLADVLIVYASVPQSAVILVRGGLAKVVHQVELSGSYGAFQEHVRLLIDGVEQVSGYEVSTGDVDDRWRELPVVLTGPLSVEDIFEREFITVSTREVVPFEPAVNCSAYFSKHEYAANIGLALSDRGNGKSGTKIRGSNLPSANMLSERHLPKPLPFRPISVYMSILIFGAVALNMTPKVDEVTLEAATLFSQIESLERTTRLRKLNQAQIRSMEMRLEEFGAMENRLQTRLNELGSEMEQTLDRLELITDDARPFGLAVSSLAIQGDEVSLSGTALSYESVIEYTANLRDMGPEMFSEVRAERVASSASADVGTSDVYVLYQVKATLPQALEGSVEEEEEE